MSIASDHSDQMETSQMSIASDGVDPLADQKEVSEMLLLDPQR
ncbi:hypothetical protein [Dictyobacter halimunensis]